MIFDVDHQFHSYLHRLEGYHLFIERLYEEHEAGMLTPTRIIEWLKASYTQGALDLAKDTVCTLGDYATALSGVKSPPRNPSQGYEYAQDALHTYYAQVFESEAWDQN